MDNTYDGKRAAQALQAFLEALGLDLKALDMEKTPQRVTELYRDLFSGLQQDTASIWGGTFETGSDGLVAVRRMPFYSVCEHHLLPFFGTVDLVYQPREGRVAGFGKFTELVQVLAHRPQLQERLTHQIADSVYEELPSDGVLVVVEAEQLCMTMRDSHSLGTKTVTSESRGCLCDPVRKQQAWLLLNRKEEE